MKNKKVLIVLPSSTLGGAERTTYNLIKGLKNITPVLFVQKGLQDLYKSLNPKMYFFEDFCSVSAGLSLKSVLSYMKAVREVVGIEQPLVIFGMMHFASLYITLAKDVFFLNTKIVASIRGNATAYFQRNPDVDFREKFMVHYFSRRSDLMIVSSIGIKNDLTVNFGAKDSKTKVIPNGIDLEWVREISKDGVAMKKDCPWIITSARLDTVQKDFLTLLRAFRIVRDSQKVKLLFIGDGPHKERITSWIKDMSLNEDVLLLGFQNNPFQYISKSDIFVLSSFFEGFGNVIVEAMALGIPVISTDCPSGPGETINHGINGFLVPVGDYKRMAEYIFSILKDSGLKNEISQAGLKRAENFSAPEMAQNYEKLFLELIGYK
jgi:glycosyltransferase involved in cell wall biosynthesis